MCRSLFSEVISLFFSPSVPQDSELIHQHQPTNNSRKIKRALLHNQKKPGKLNQHECNLPYQQLVEVLDVIWFQEWQVARWLVIDTLHSAVLCLHVESCHPPQGRRSRCELPSRSADGHVTSWGWENLKKEAENSF